MGLVIFMYHMFIINQQVDDRKRVVPHDYPTHLANFSWFCVISKTIPKGIANELLKRTLASSFHPRWIGHGNVYTRTFLRKNIPWYLIK
jgi:hypothetical protein